MYKYLLFDLDDTLLDFKLAEATAISGVLKGQGVEPTLETVEIYSKINESCWKRFEKGEITRDEIYQLRVEILGQKLGVTFDHKKFTNEYFISLSRQGQVLPDALDLLKTLRSKGYVLAAITNGSLAIQTKRLICSGLTDFFDGGIFISEEIGFKKPQPEFFEYVLERLGFPEKHSVLVLGDSLSGDIAGALSVGLDCCFVRIKGQDISSQIVPTYTVNKLADIPSICGL